MSTSALVGPLVPSGELVERDEIPVAHQADPSGAVVDEQLGHRDLAARDQDAVRRELGIDVRLASPFRAELDQVVVALAIGDQAHQLHQLAAPAEELGVEADALDQQIDPFVRGELPARGQVAVEIEVRELDRLERLQDPRADLFVLGVLVG